MENFPSSIPNPEYPFKPEHEDNSITTKFEDGTVQSRLKFTRSRCTWTLNWKGLKQSDYDTLEYFIKHTVKHAAVKFNWTDPVKNVTHVVRCVKFESSMEFINNWNVELKLQEA